MYTDNTLINFNWGIKSSGDPGGKNSYLEKEENPVDKTYEQPNKKKENSALAF